MSEQANTAEVTEEADNTATPEAGQSTDANVEQSEDYQPAEFNDSSQAASQAGISTDGKLDIILDIPVTLSMEVGHARISIQQLLQLAQGSVVELDRLAGEPLDVLVNGTLVARGEVVVVNENFGVRLLDVISPEERVSKLK